MNCQMLADAIRLEKSLLAIKCLVSISPVSDYTLHWSKVSDIGPFCLISLSLKFYESPWKSVRERESGKLSQIKMPPAFKILVQDELGYFGR